MKFKPVKLAPALIAACVIVLVCLARLLHLDFVQRLEQLTYDMRVREALKFAPTVATNLGFVDINDASIVAVRTGDLGYHYGLYWPRQVYGRLVEELAAQKAKAVALDVILGELRRDHPPVQMADGSLMESDDFFALQMRRAGNVIIADTRNISPPDLFCTNALALGDITTDINKDSDGVLRRAQVFRVRRRWHPLFQQASRDYEVDLSKAQIEPRRIIFHLPGGEEIKVPLDSQGEFALTNVLRRALPPGIPPKAKPFVDERVWHMGIVLAAQELGLDLSRAEVDLDHGQITLRGNNGVKRVIPVDKDGCFCIDWCLTTSDARLMTEPIQTLLLQDKLRLQGTNNLPALWAGKLVVVGSTATGNDLTDLGATPLESETFLAGEHWNVANSIITGRFISRTSIETDLLLIAVMGILAAVLTWRLRALLAFLLVMLTLVGYVALGNYLFVHYRHWLPMILPVLGALLTTHVCLVTWRVVSEQAEKRRVKAIFSTVVSPKIMNELLKAEKLSLGGARREVTVLFADVRGFTEFTDTSQERTAGHVAENNLSGEAAEACFTEQARETLATVNLYLGLVADTIIRHDATLDKFIGDCVMAFWGAPTPNPRHTLACVRAAIEVQRSVYELNRHRSDENNRRQLENVTRVASGLAPRPLLPILLLGSGINTGMVTVGIMGSETKAGVGQGNYTVFGREVNLASRLENLSGRGRILISEASHRLLLRDDPVLAATCVPLPDVMVKGIRSAVKVYEVPWKPAGYLPLKEESCSGGTGEDSAAATFAPRGKV